MLIFPIERKWYDMIKRNEKKEEYRRKCPYYDARLKKHLGKETTVFFRNGYSRISPTIEAKIFVTLKEGRPEWGAIPGVIYYTLIVLEQKEIQP